MSKEIYIIIGLCIFAFLLGGRIKKSIQNTGKKGKLSKKKAKVQQKELSPSRMKARKIFTTVILVFIFGMLIFMIPALSRDIISANGVYTENLILRIIIVGFCLYILFYGFIKLRKSKK